MASVSSLPVATVVTRRSFCDRYSATSWRTAGSSSSARTCAAGSLMDLSLGMERRGEAARELALGEGLRQHLDGAELARARRKRRSHHARHDNDRDLRAQPADFPRQLGAAE